MNTISRGIRNAFRNVIRTCSIVLILGLSIGLVIAMLAARHAVSDKIETVKSSVATAITISPAGVRGFEGGGEALTAEMMAKVAETPNISRLTSTLQDRMTSETTNLESAIEAGSFGRRQAGNSGVDIQQPPQMEMRAGAESGASVTRTFTPPVMITGVSDTTNTSIFGGNTITWKSGQVFDASKDDNVAVLGTAIAEKNNLKVGSTFQAYGTDIQVTGIYDAGNTFANNGVFLSLVSLQRLSSQTSAISSATAYANSSENLASTTKAISSILGDKADVTNTQEQADNTLKPLQSVKQISTYSLIGSLVAGATIILLTMMMIVRERRREIGVMKAIGASNIGIMTQFAVEAITLTVLGLIIGIILGIVTTGPIANTLIENSTSSPETTQQVIRGGPPMMRGFGATSQQALQNISATVSYQVLILGLGATLLIATVGSAIPSYIISKIKPAEAMRNE